VLCLRVLQASVSYLNTLLIQDVLDGGELQLAAEDQRAITPPPRRSSATAPPT
jgi:hypothetical protein